jgi:hypothetical protein
MHVQAAKIMSVKLHCLPQHLIGMFNIVTCPNAAHRHIEIQYASFALNDGPLFV